MRVGVEHAEPQHHRVVEIDQRVGHPGRVDSRRTQRVDVRDLDAVEVVHRQHASRREPPVDARDDHVVAAGEDRGDLLGGATFVDEVDLLGGAALHLRHDKAEVDRALDARPDLGQEADGLEVPAHDALDLRVLHLHRHVGALDGARAVDLRERGGRDRLPLERCVQLVDVAAELRFDHRTHLRPWTWRDRVVEQ